MVISQEGFMSTVKKLDSIGFRISPENKELIRMAAEITGQDMTSYLVSTALDKAKKDLLEHKQIEALFLSKRDFEKVESELKSPSKPNAKMEKAFKAHTKKFEE
jgi:uncharacterized protein (DUF1778 family)